MLGEGLDAIMGVHWAPRPLSLLDAVVALTKQYYKLGVAEREQGRQRVLLYRYI